MSSLSNGVSLPETYEPLPDDRNFLGKGNFGEVVRVRRRSDNKIVACKTISFQDTGRVKEMAERERSILSLLNHQNIITLLDVRLIPNRIKIYMEYCEHGSLQDLINETERSVKRLSEDYIWRIAFQISAALLYCHYGIRGKDNGELINPPQPRNAVLHRDIKPANVFLASPDEQDLTAIKLGDFGLGQILQTDTSPASYVGTHQYMPPEISRLRQDQIVWTTHCDVFSFGCTMYHACTFKPPFEWRMESGQTYDPLPAYYSADLQIFINGCLSFRPETRPNSLRLFQRAQHKVQSQGHKDLLRMAGFSEDDLAVSPGTVMVSAVANSDKPLIEYLLYRNVNVNARCHSDSVGSAAIHKAARCGLLEILRLLLHNGADVNLKDDRGRIPLHWAIGEGSEAAARCLLENGSDLTIKDSEGDTPLHFAATLSRAVMLQLLLDSGADVNMTNGYGDTPLHSAARGNDPALDAVKLFLRSGAEVDVSNKEGETPLYVAVTEGNGHVVLHLLIEGNASVNCRCTNGNSPLNAAAEFGFIDIARSLLEQGANIYQLNLTGRAPLHTAAGRGRVDFVRLLLDRNAETNACDRQGHTPLHVAASHGFVEIVRLLVDHKGDMDCYDYSDWTPLHWAAFKGHVDVVRLLLERGANLKVMYFPDRRGRTGWDRATPDVIKMMREWEQRRTTLRAILSPDRWLHKSGSARRV